MVGRVDLARNVLYHGPMDLDAIAVFVKVVETGSFSGAARALEMPKTTVSAKVAALERRLKVTLIQRTTRRLNVTDAGRIYFQHCVLAVQEIERGESALQAGQDEPRGLLKITAPGDLGRTLLPKIVSAFMKRNPHIEAELIVTNRMVDLLAESVDLGIRAGTLKDSTMVARRFFEIETCLYATPAYLKKIGSPTHPRELEKHQLVTFTPMRNARPVLTDGKVDYPLAMPTKISTDDFESVKAFVLLQEGIGWIPNFLVARELRSKELVPVLPKWKMKSSGQFSFVYPGQRYASVKVRAFIEFALEALSRLETL